MGGASFRCAVYKSVRTQHAPSASCNEAAQRHPRASHASTPSSAAPAAGCDGAHVGALQHRLVDHARVVVQAARQAAQGRGEWGKWRGGMDGQCVGERCPSLPLGREERCLRQQPPARQMARAAWPPPPPSPPPPPPPPLQPPHLRSKTMGCSAPIASRNPNSRRSSARAAAESGCCDSGWAAGRQVGERGRGSKAGDDVRAEGGAGSGCSQPPPQPQRK